jgi:hypothetical protein
MRHPIACLAAAAAVALFVPAPLCADIWDVGSETDNGNLSDNTPTHGMDQVHDLSALAGPVADEDWFRLCLPVYGSYEVIVDGLTGDLSEAASLRLDLVDSAGAVQQSAVTEGVGDENRVLRFFSTTIGCGGPSGKWIRVSGADCGTTCGPNDRYRIRFYDTQIAVPRYNNANGQVTVLIIQNPTDYDVVFATATLWDAAGAAVTAFVSSLAPKASVVTNLASVNGGVANGTAGTVTVASTAGYGALAVKAVALEPATGFSFDSPGLYRPR